MINAIEPAAIGGCTLADVVAKLGPAMQERADIRVLCCQSVHHYEPDALADGDRVASAATRLPLIFVAPMPYPEALDEKNALRIECAGSATTRCRVAVVGSGGSTRANVILVGPVHVPGAAADNSLCRADDSISRRSLATRKLVTESDIANTLLWLARSAPQFLSGTVIPLDGGMNMGRYI